MIVYHGGYCERRTPEIIESRYATDFGIGFYCTEIKLQADDYNSSMYYENPDYLFISYQEGRPV